MRQCNDELNWKYFNVSKHNNKVGIQSSRTYSIIIVFVLFQLPGENQYLRIFKELWIGNFSEFMLGHVSCVKVNQR